MSESARSSAEAIHLNNYWSGDKRSFAISNKYICETGFSALALVVKNKRRNQLQPEDDFRCALTTIKPILTPCATSSGTRFQLKTWKRRQKIHFAKLVLM